MRFPEFSGEWEKKRLQEECSFFSGGTPSSSNKEYYDGDIPFIRSGEIDAQHTELFLTQKGYNSSSAKMVEIGDLLLALYGATSGEIAISKMHGAINQAILCIRSPYNNVFVKSVWEKHVQHILQAYLQGGQGNLSADIVKKLSFYFPSIREQNKVSEFVTLIDQRIETQNKIIQHLESLITGITQSVRDNATKKVLLADILTEKDEKNIGNHDVYSVSVSEGVINQIDYLGRSFAAKETKNYNVVEYGDIVYTKSPTGSFPYGIVKQSYIKEKAAVSPLYGVYKPVSFEVGYYLHHYFTSPIYTTNYLHKLIQKGAKNTINITNQRFLENYIPLPSPEVLEKYVALVSAVTAKLENEKQVLSKLKEQKNYLLSKMFI